MIGRDFGANVEEIVLADAEFMDNRLWLNFGLAEKAALRLGDILCLGDACTKLNGRIAVTFCFAARDDLKPFQLQDGDRHVAAVVLEQAGHAHLLRDHAGTHDP